jgi:hypothetical protein
LPQSRLGSGWGMGRSYVGRVRLGLYDPTAEGRIEYLEPRLCPRSLEGADRMILLYNELVCHHRRPCRVLAVFPVRHRRPKLRPKVFHRQADVESHRRRQIGMPKHSL